jgi:Mor family transcriptional regulator
VPIEFRKNLKGYQHPKHRLQPGDDAAIRQRYENGESQRKLAREFRVSQPTIFRIVWKVSYDDTPDFP